MKLAEPIGPSVTLASRVERKYVLPQVRASATSAWLRHACRPASEYATGTVTSCYFDTPDLEAYHGSADGAWEKAKVRVRWYDERAVPASVWRIPRSSFRAFDLPAFLELKGRTGVESWKRRLPIVLSRDALSEPSGGARFPTLIPPALLLELLAKLGYSARGALQPVALVRYERERFEEPVSGLRVSLDHQIEVAAPWRQRATPLRTGEAVVELKGPDAGLPRRLAALGRFAQPWTANSKYAAAVEALDLVEAS